LPDADNPVPVNNQLAQGPHKMAEVYKET